MAYKFNVPKLVFNLFFLLFLYDDVILDFGKFYVLVLKLYLFYLYISLVKLPYMVVSVQEVIYFNFKIYFDNFLELF
jgi:hypothetical protein